MNLNDESPLSELVASLKAPYHTDIFITKTLNFRPTQTDNILRNNHSLAQARVMNGKFDGEPDSTNYVSIFDVYQNLFPDLDTFINYLNQRTPSSSFPLALSYIISRKAEISDKRQEIHELALDEMRAILSMPTEVDNPHYDPNNESSPQFITDHKTLNLKVNIFKHLDGQKQKQIIHNQNIEVRMQIISGKSGHGVSGRNPTLLGYGETLPHNIVKRRLTAQNSQYENNQPNRHNQSPQEILNDIISDTGDNVIDVTPKKAELMREDESVLEEKLLRLREEEAKAMHIPRPK